MNNYREKRNHLFWCCLWITVSGILLAVVALGAYSLTDSGGSTASVTAPTLPTGPTPTLPANPTYPQFASYCGKYYALANGSTLAWYNNCMGYAEMIGSK